MPGTYHVVKVLAVRLLERAYREGHLVDPLLPAALEPKDSVTVVHARALTSAPELRLCCVDLSNERLQLSIANAFVQHPKSLIRFDWGRSYECPSGVDLTTPFAPGYVY